jgi:DNA polymerase-3 subunit gamma/tau
MSYQILSLKWRPLSFDQIVGQDHITQTLKNAISMNRLAQAFLFSGPRGVGKTTTARVLASTINDVQNYEKCLDIIELDGASNRGIDEIRDIKESVKFPPSSVKYKVYIIDEAHMLTEQAFNALLKTLEEPPSYIIFILATTDPQKMPQTILSRTQRYDFMRIGGDIIVDRLKYILNEEKLEFEENAIKLISQKSDGSMRDALSMLDQIIAFSDNRITVENLRSAIGLIDQEDMYNFFENIITQDTDRAINLFNSIINSGISSKLFINDLSSFLNDCMLLKINKDNRYTFMSDSLKIKISKNLPFEMDDILKMIKLAFNLTIRLKFIENSKISIEVLIVDYVNIINANNIYKKLKTDSRNEPSEPLIDNPEIIPVIEPQIKQNKNINKDESVEADEIKNPNEEEAVVQSLNPPDDVSSEATIDSIKAAWNDIISYLDQKNSKLSSFLEETHPKQIKENKLILELDNGNQFIKKVLDTDKTIIIDAIDNICNISLDILIEMVESEVGIEEEKKKSNKEEKDHPLLDDAINIFKGKIIS